MRTRRRAPLRLDSLEDRAVPAGELDPAFEPRIAYAGARHLGLAAATRERLAALEYDFERLKSLMLRLDLTTVQLVWRESADVFHVRDPFPVGGVVEDPATGAAAAALGGYLRETGLVPPAARLTLHQGHDLGRGGEGEGGNEDGIARADAGRHQRQKKRIRAARAADGVADADIVGQLCLEGRHIGAVNVAAIGNDTGNGRLYPAGQPFALALEIDKLQLGLRGATRFSDRALLVETSGRASTCRQKTLIDEATFPAWDFGRALLVALDARTVRG
jgi:hypothetical protein